MKNAELKNTCKVFNINLMKKNKILKFSKIRKKRDVRKSH